MPHLPRSVGLGPVFFPAQRRLRHRSVQALPAPVDPLRARRTPEALPSTGEEDPLLRPFLEVAVQRAGGAELRRGRLPLAARSQHVENAVQDLTAIHPRPTARWIVRYFGSSGSTRSQSSSETRQRVARFVPFPITPPYIGGRVNHLRVALLLSHLRVLG